MPNRHILKHIGYIFWQHTVILINRHQQVHIQAPFFFVSEKKGSRVSEIINNDVIIAQVLMSNTATNDNNNKVFINIPVSIPTASWEKDFWNLSSAGCWYCTHKLQAEGFQDIQTSPLHPHMNMDVLWPKLNLSHHCFECYEYTFITNIAHGKAVAL